jgi:hypothetical protein
LVKAGVRNELLERLDGKWSVRKETIPLPGASMSVTPGLLFGCGDAIGDVKYKRARAKWLRSDLYEVTALAAAAGASRAPRIRNKTPAAVVPPVELSGVSVVVAGAFNPAIFNPYWLVEKGLMSENATDAAVERGFMAVRDLAVFTADWLSVQVTLEGPHSRQSRGTRGRSSRSRQGCLRPTS